MITPQGLIKNHEKKLHKLEQKVLENHKRMQIYHSTLLQQPIFYKKGSLKQSLKNIKNTCQ